LAGAHTAEGGEVLDETARNAYKRRLSGLDAEIEEAETWNDPVRESALRQERQVLVDHLAQAYGLMGRPREFGSAPERARVAVRKAITAAMDSIAAADPATAALLRRGVRTGRFCRYEPDPGRSIHWQTEP
jgi:chromosome segregation ATPase